MIFPQCYNSMTQTPQNFIDGTFSIQGLIGAGKSTFINILRSKEEKLEKIFGKPVIFIDEPVNQWNTPVYNDNTLSALEVFYANKELHGFTFQVFAFTTRMEYLLKETSNLKKLSICITDRSMLSDKEVFFEYLKDKLHPLQVDTYNRFYDIMCSNFNQTEKAIFYIETTPEECMVRIKERDAKGDRGITPEYLQAHDILHKKMIEQFESRGGKVYRIKPPYFKDKTQLDKYIDDFLDNLIIQ